LYLTADDHISVQIKVVTN